MKISSSAHLTYCTNIHSGEHWEDIFSALKISVPRIKKKISPHNAFGVGLRLSDIASRELLFNSTLESFKDWLHENDLYVFTINGFVFGGFHNVVVKDNVHAPDWSTDARKDFTLRMFHILSQLLPAGIDGGISTSPLSYRHWCKNENDVKNVFASSANNIKIVANALHQIKKESGQVLHLDIEPEADGVIENTDEAIDFFKNYLLGEDEEIIREHIRICYDACHFAVGYELPDEAIQKFTNEGIQIGKVQISAALNVFLPKEKDERKKLYEILLPFAESSYLHQTIEKKSSGEFLHYQDLHQALENIFTTDANEWRIHYHIPVFMQSYGTINSTQEDILALFYKQRMNKFTNHFEVETYTWEVLPPTERLPLEESISRELEWTLQHLQ